MLRQALEVVVGILGLHGDRDEGVDVLVGQGNRLVHAVHGARGVQDDGAFGGLLPAIDDRRGLVLLEEVLHEETALELAEQRHVHLADGLECGDAVLSVQRALEKDDVAQAEHLAVAEQAFHELGEAPDLRDHQVRDLLPLDHGVHLLLVEEVEVIDEGHGGARHVETIEREGAFRQRRGNEADTRVVLTRDAHPRERLCILFPVTEHLTIRVGPIPVPNGDAVEALIAEGIHFLDERPRGLVQIGSAFKLLRKLSELIPFAFLHDGRMPSFPRLLNTV